MTHDDPRGPFGYEPYGPTWVANAEDAMSAAANLADAAARNVADWVVRGLPMDAYRETHYRRSRAAERYAHAVYTERVAASR